MAHYHFNSSGQYGALLRSNLNLCEAADDGLSDIVDLMSKMLTGDGSQDSHYDVVRDRFGFLSSADAHGAFNELSSANSKTSGNGSVTNSRAARDQLFSMLRG